MEATQRRRRQHVEVAEQGGHVADGGSIVQCIRALVLDQGAYDVYHAGGGSHVGVC